MEDFPAAHSMDTAWFAVDAEGNVARFESGEDGAVPLSAATGGYAAEPSFDVFELDCVVAARVLERPGPERDKARFTEKMRVILVLDASASATYRAAPQSSIEAKLPGLRVLRESDPRIVASMDPVEPALLNEIAAHADVKELVTEHELRELVEENDGGIFTYAREHGDEPGAYERKLTPERALKLAELPAAIRDHLASMRFPLRFSSSARVHLADHIADEEAAIYNDVTLRGVPRKKTFEERERRPSNVLPMAIIVITVFALLAYLARK